MQINWINVWTGGSAVLLVGADAALLTEAGAWALSGLAHLAPTVSTVLYVIAGFASLWATIAFARLVHRVEPFYGPASQTAEIEASPPAGRSG